MDVFSSKIIGHEFSTHSNVVMNTLDKLKSSCIVIHHSYSISLVDILLALGDTRIQKFTENERDILSDYVFNTKP
jgi:hypothetical protein